MSDLFEGKLFGLWFFVFTRGVTFHSMPKRKTWRCEKTKTKKSENVKKPKPLWRGGGLPLAGPGRLVVSLSGSSSLLLRGLRPKIKWVKGSEGKRRYTWISNRSWSVWSIPIPTAVSILSPWITLFSIRCMVSWFPWFTCIIIVSIWLVSTFSWFFWFSNTITWIPRVSSFSPSSTCIPSCIPSIVSWWWIPIPSNVPSACVSIPKTVMRKTQTLINVPISFIFISTITVSLFFRLSIISWFSFTRRMCTCFRFMRAVCFRSSRRVRSSRVTSGWLRTRSIGMVREETVMWGFGEWITYWESESLPFFESWELLLLPRSSVN